MGDGIFGDETLVALGDLDLSELDSNMRMERAATLLDLSVGRART